MLIALSFLMLRFGLDHVFWREISVYWSYLFEAAFVAASFRRWKWGRAPRLGRLGRLMALGAAAGAISCAAVRALAIPIPFDFSSVETMFLLLMLAPTLEEGIFRWGLWNPILSPRWAWAATSVVFSAAHALSLASVPEAYRGFIVAQTVYTLGLGLLAGWGRLTTGHVLGGVAVHAGFNLAFWVVAVVVG